MADLCPTCGETGPDVFDRVGDYGGDVWEARCGDEWHDRFCGRTLVGQGSDTWDPVCQLLSGHDSACSAASHSPNDVEEKHG